MWQVSLDHINQENAIRDLMGHSATCMRPADVSAA